MSPEECIAALDDALAADGQLIELRRGVATSGLTDVPASVRAFRPEELIGGITQDDSLVILSPSSIGDGQFPPVQSASAARDMPTWLPQKNDRVVADGRSRNIMFVKPFKVANRVVRIELTVSG